MHRDRSTDPPPRLTGQLDGLRKKDESKRLLYTLRLFKHRHEIDRVEQKSIPLCQRGAIFQNGSS